MIKEWEGGLGGQEQRVVEKSGKDPEEDHRGWGKKKKSPGQGSRGDGHTDYAGSIWLSRNP